MNRIAHLVNIRQEKDLRKEGSGLMAPVESQVTTCTFCGESMGSERSDFNALSADAKAGICSICIEKYARMAKLGKLLKLGTNNDAWEDLSRKMLAATYGIKATEDARGHAIGIALRLAKRSYQAMTGVHTEPLRLRLQSEDPDAFADMVASASAEAGIVSVICDDKCLRDKINKFRDFCSNDGKMLEHAVLLVVGHSIPEAAMFSVVCLHE